MSEGSFTSGNLMRHVSVTSFTASIGITAIFAVDFVDMLFISMLGNEALAAAVGYAGTLLFFTNAINMGMSIVAGTLVAKSVGAGASQQARDYTTAIAISVCLLGVLIPILLIPQLDLVLGLLGATDDTLRYAQSYCSIILPAMSCMGLAMTTMAVLRAYGDAKKAMYVAVIGGVVNAAFDPLLIFVVDLGLDGAAYASVAGRIAMMISGLLWVLSPTEEKGLSRPSFSLVQQNLMPITAIAVPSILANLATPIGSAFITRAMAEFGSQAVAAMAVIGRLTPLAFAVVLALSSSIGPIIGQNFGAKKMDRVRGAFLDGIKFLALYVCVVTILLFLSRSLIAEMFDATDEMVTLIYLFCGPLALCHFFNGLIFICNAGYNNLGHPIYSTYLNWGRNTIGTIPFILLGASIAGASGILIGQAVGGILLSLIGLFFAWRLIDNLTHQAHEHDHFSLGQRLHEVSCERHW